MDISIDILINVDKWAFVVALYYIGRNLLNKKKR